MTDFSFMALPQTTIADSVRDFEWDFDIVVNWLAEIISYHVANNGFYAIIILFIIALVVLFSLDATRPVTGLVFSNLLRAIISTGTNVVAVITFFTLKITKDIIFSKSRHALRAIIGLFRSKQD